MADLTPEEAIVIRDEEVKEYNEGRILKHPNGQKRKGYNGQPLLNDSTKYKTVYEDVESKDKDGKLTMETVKKEVRAGGYQITYNK